MMREQDKNQDLFEVPKFLTRNVPKRKKKCRNLQLQQSKLEKSKRKC